MKKILLLSMGLWLALSSASAEVVTEAVAYSDGGTALTGTLAYDTTAQSPRPAVLLAHEWWGKNAYAERRAKEIAGLGYVVLASDMYGTGVQTLDPKKAQELSKPFYTSRELMRTRAQKALEVLRANSKVDPSKVIALGYCFGGTVALELARSGADLKGVVVFHGGLATPNEKDNANIKAPVLILGGADDPFVPVAERAAFKSSLANYKVPLYFIEYPGAVHAFTNPEVDAIKLEGARYNKAADEGSWEQMKAFLAVQFK